MSPFFIADPQPRPGIPALHHHLIPKFDTYLGLRYRESASATAPLGTKPRREAGVRENSRMELLHSIATDSGDP